MLVNVWVNKFVHVCLDVSWLGVIVEVDFVKSIQNYENINQDCSHLYSFGNNPKEISILGK